MKYNVKSRNGANSAVSNALLITIYSLDSMFRRTNITRTTVARFRDCTRSKMNAILDRSMIIYYREVTITPPFNFATNVTHLDDQNEQKWCNVASGILSTSQSQLLNVPFESHPKYCSPIDVHHHRPLYPAHVPLIYHPHQVQPRWP